MGDRIGLSRIDLGYKRYRIGQKQIGRRFFDVQGDNKMCR